VINTIYTIGDEGVPLMAYIVAQHQRDMRSLMSQKIPKTTLNQSFSSTLFQQILKRIIAGETENENQDQRMEIQ